MYVHVLMYTHEHAHKYTQLTTNTVYIVSLNMLKNRLHKKIMFHFSRFLATFC